MIETRPAGQHTVDESSILRMAGGLPRLIIGTVRAPAGREERGAVVVEFAVVLPILVLFIFGIIEFGRAYSAKIELTAAVREGARTAALAEGACGTTPVLDCVVESTRTAASGLTADSITVTPDLCSGTPTPTNASVRATYPFTYDIPLFGRGTWTLNAKGVMRCGG